VTTESQTGQAVDGVPRHREYGLLYFGTRWYVIHQRLDNVWHIVGAYATQAEAQTLIDRIYGRWIASRRDRRPPPPPRQLTGQLDIYGNEETP
jgi:hypothetical protein